MVELPALSKELDLLVAADLGTDAALAAAVDAARATGINWDRFGDLVLKHGVGGLVGARLGQIAPGAAPEDLTEMLQMLMQRHAVRRMVQTGISVKVSGFLGRAGIRSLILKGSALAETAYAPHPEWRNSSDIDILIEGEDLLEADRLMTAEGFVRSWPEGDLPTAGLDMFLLMANVFNYTCTATGQLIELHHRITTNPGWIGRSFDSIYETSVSIESQYGAFRGLGGPLQVRYLCWHATAHQGFRLKWFTDIARVVRQAGAANCTGYAASDGDHSARIATQVTDQVLSALCPDEFPPVPVLPQLRKQKAAARILSDLENPSEIPSSRNLGSLASELGFLAFQLQLSGGLKTKAYQLLLTFADARDVYTLGLGRRYCGVYAIAGPILSFCRLLTRRPGGNQS